MDWWSIERSIEIRHTTLKKSLMETGYRVTSVGIIGGGPAGLAALYELLHVNHDGSSTVHDGKFPIKPRFEEIVLFERNEGCGGVWRYSSVPGQDLTPELVENNFNEPEVVCPPAQLTHQDLLPFTYDHPFSEPLNLESNYPPKLEWYQSAVYPSLYTNTPELLMRFSYQPRTRVAPDDLAPFVPHGQVLENLASLGSMPEMTRHMRFNSSVQFATKIENGTKWEVTVREFVKTKNGQQKFNWYKQRFDSVIVASGRQNYPNYPSIEGMPNVIKDLPGIISHSKNFRLPSQFDQEVRKRRKLASKR